MNNGTIAPKVKPKRNAVFGSGASESLLRLFWGSIVDVRFLPTNTSQIGRFRLSKTFSSAVELNSDRHTQKKTAPRGRWKSGPGVAAVMRRGFPRRSA